MGIDFDYCRACKQTHPDCGNIQVKTCEKCKENICSDCLEKNIDTSKVKYWKDSEVGSENSDEEILEEFCPLCNPKTKKQGKAKP